MTANRLLRAAKATDGTKKLRLQSLAYAFQIRARQLEKRADEAVYQEAVTYFKAGIATVSGDSADPRDLVGALIGCLAKDGLDADEIRASKRYIRRFVEDVATGRQIIGTSKLSSAGGRSGGDGA
jgi:ribosomal protein S11